MKMEDKDRFFRFVHSAGRLDPRGCSIDLEKRRIYQDLEEMVVLSTNNQYAGNSVGLKKHAMRLAIRLSGKEGWLCEHMFIMACTEREKGSGHLLLRGVPFRLRQDCHGHASGGKDRGR